MVGGTSIIPFAERKFIYKQQGNPAKSTGMAIQQLPKRLISEGGERMYYKWICRELAVIGEIF